MITKTTLLVAMLIATIVACHAQIETVIDTDYGPTHMYDVNSGIMTYDATRGILLASMLDFGVWKSTDGGATFISASTGIDPYDASFFARISIQNDSEYVFLGDGNNRRSVYRSTDGGSTFERVVLPVQPRGPGIVFESGGVMWLAYDGILGYDGGREWTTIANPNGNKPQGYLILSERSVAINDGTEWHEFNVGTKTWAPLDLPRTTDRLAIRTMQAVRLSDGRLIWSENGSLMVGTGATGQKRSIDSVYLPAQGRRVQFKSFQIRRFKEHVLHIDSSGVIGRWDHDSITYISTGVSGSINYFRAYLRYQRVNGRDILFVAYPTSSKPYELYQIEVIDLHTARLIRSVSHRFSPVGVGDNTDQVAMLNDSTIVVGGGQGAMTRIPMRNGPRMTMRSIADSMIMRRKTAMYDGHILNDGSLLTHTEHGRWLHRRSDTAEKTIPFAHGNWIARVTNDSDLKGYWGFVPTGFSFMKIDGDSGIIVGPQGVRVSLQDMTEKVLRDSLTTYAYREPGSDRLFMGAHDVRWTTDAGMTWHATSAGLPSNDSGPLPCISNLLKTRRGTMVLGLRGFGRRFKEEIETDSVPGGICYSVDDGASWSRANGLEDHGYVHNIVELANGDLLAVVSHVTIKLGVIDISMLLPMAALMRDNTIVRSKDGGRTWEIVQTTSETGPFIDIRGTIVTMTSGDIVAHLSETKVVRSTDGGTSWNPEGNAPSWLQSIHAIDADASDRLYFFTDHGVFRQSTPTSVEDGVIPQDVSMSLHVVDGVLHGSFDATDMPGTTITIVDLQGRTMRSFAAGGEFTTSVAGLPSGLYVVMASGRWGRASQSVVVVH